MKKLIAKQRTIKAVIFESCWFRYHCILINKTLKYLIEEVGIAINIKETSSKLAI